MTAIVDGCDTNRMHPQTFFSTLTSRKFLPIFIMLVIFLAGVFFILSLPIGRVLQKKGAIVSPTPIPSSFHGKTFATKQFVVQYPSNWKQDIPDSPQSEIKSFTFTVAGKSYRFADNPPTGQSLGEAGSLGVDTIVSTNALYGGRNFLRSIWYVKGKPIFIQAMPNEKGFNFDIFSMELPPEDTQQYIDQFDEMLKGLQFTGDFQPPLTPAPTMQAPQTLHLN